MWGRNVTRNQHADTDAGVQLFEPRVDGDPIRAVLRNGARVEQPFERAVVIAAEITFQRGAEGVRDERVAVVDRVVVGGRRGERHSAATFHARAARRGSDKVCGETRIRSAGRWEAGR